MPCTLFRGLDGRLQVADPFVETVELLPKCGILQPVPQGGLVHAGVASGLGDEGAPAMEGRADCWRMVRPEI